MSTRNNRNTTRKVVGSLGVIGAAAAVAGLGTFGTFTDSTTPVTTQVTSGTVDINLAQGPIAVPAGVANFVPGDSLSRAVTLSNNGNSALSSVTLDVTSSTSTVLTTDATKGLQLSLKSCSVAWTQGGTTDAPTYACSGTQRDLITAGQAVGTDELVTPNSLNPGGTDNLVFTISLPTTADNAFQGKSSALTLTFTGVQRNGTAR
ncbi:TasA family protein [Geodermatophilus sp. SYSU D00703]